MLYTDIFWDFDGTLFDSYPAIVQGMRDALLTQGVDATLGEIHDLVKISMQKALQFYMSKYALKPAFAERLSVFYKSQPFDAMPPFPGAVSLVRKLSSMGARNYLVTHRGVSALGCLEFYGLADCFTDCTTSADGFLRKPDPAAILHLMRKHNVDAARAIMIGDRDIDIMAGVNAGIRGGFFEPDIRRTCEQAVFTARSMAELADKLEVS